jgi:hypothetical protein
MFNIIYHIMWSRIASSAPASIEPSQPFSIKVPFCHVRMYLVVKNRLVEIQRERSFTCDKVPVCDDIYQWIDSPLLKHMTISIEQKGYIWEDDPALKSLLYSFTLSVPDTMPTINIYNRQKRLMCMLPHVNGMTSDDVCDFLDQVNIFLPGNPFVNYVWDGPNELPSHMIVDMSPLFNTVMVREW